MRTRTPKPSYIRGKKRFVYLPGSVRIYESASPNTKNIDHTLAPEADVPKGGAEGVLVCCGGASAGYTLFIKDGKLHWEHNWFEESRFRVSSTEPIPEGHRVLSAEVKVDKEGTFGTGGTVTLRMGEKQIGCDTVSPVSDLCESPFPFTGKIRRVLVDISDSEFQDVVAMAKVAMATQ